MSTALERRLQRAFARLPQPTRDVSRRARAAALATLPSEETSGWLGVVLAVAVTVVLVGAGAAALAATGNLHVRLGREQPRPRPAPAHLQVPRSTNGIAVVAGGRLWLATRRGLRIEGMPVSAAELSPRALYAVVGLGSALVAFAPGPRRAWTHDAGGRVVAAAWSPDGLKIAYVVRRGAHFELRLIEGDGDDDRVLTPRVAPVQPSWRFDSLALAYVNSRGNAAVTDFSLGARRAFRTRQCGGVAEHVAYARRALRLAVATRRGLTVVQRWDQRPPCALFDPSRVVESLAWVGPRELVAGIAATNAHAGAATRFRLDLNEAATADSVDPVRAVAADPNGPPQLLVALRRPSGALVVGVAPQPVFGSRLRLTDRLLRLSGLRASTVSLSWR
jgi:hypothetical protein